MDLPLPASVKCVLITYTSTLQQAFLLIAILLKELVFLCDSLLRGTMTLDDLVVRCKSPKPSELIPTERVERNVHSPVSDSGESDTTSVAPNRRLVTAAEGLCRAIVRRDVKAVTRMLNAAPSLAAKQHEGGWYPLHAAVLTGDVELVELVVSQPGVNADAELGSNRCKNDPDVEGEFGNLPEGTKGARALHYACMVGSIDIIKVLVRHGASLCNKDDKKREPLEYFDIERDLDAVVVFRDILSEHRKREDFYREYSIDEVADLIREDKYDVFERVIRKKPSLIGNYTYYDFKLLHLAVIRQRHRFAELIVSISSSGINHVDSRSGYTSDTSHSSFAPSTIPHRYVKDATALHYACLVQDLHLIELLLKAGANWDITDRKNRKPEEVIYVHDSASNDFKVAFERLRDAEAEKRKKEDEGKTKEEEQKDSPDSGDASGQANSDENLKDNSYSSSEGSGATSPDADEVQKVSVETLLKLEETLEEKLVAQHGPIRTVANAIRLRASGWVDADRPLVLLFLGSSGVGKTELAKQLALYVHGRDGLGTDKGKSVADLEKRHAFVRIDMSEYQESHTAMNLIGAPKSYVGYEDGGALTQALKKNSKATVLLDEIEKAHPDVLTLFLQVFDDGRLTDSKDGVISCKDATFIMTSNIAAETIKEKAPELRELIGKAEEENRPELYLDVIRQFTQSIRPSLKRALKRDEFIGRINHIAVFLPLSADDIAVVVKRELEIWCKRSEEKHSITLSWTDEVVRKLASAYDVNYGVRSIANEVQAVAIQLVAQAQMTGQIQKNWAAVLSTNEAGDIVMECFAKTEPES